MPKSKSTSKSTSKALGSKPRSFALALVLPVAALGFAAGVSRSARADKAPVAPVPAAAPSCKAFGSAKCCDPAIAAHLTKAAVFKACGESDATFLGEAGSKETCKYVFKVEGEKPEETFVQVYAPAQKEVPSSPNDPFFSWKKVGKAYVTDKAKSPKAAPMMANSTGIWLPAKGYFVSINASTKVCTKVEASKLAAAVK
jgi:hypothetical protein